MSRDWFDPFGIRGSRLDPFVIFTNALTGRGPAGQSAEFVSTTIARQIVGRRVQIDAGVTISATVAAVDEARPPAPLAALPSGAAEVPMWERVRLRLDTVTVGERTLDRATVDASDIRLVGATAQAVRVGTTVFSATIVADEVVRWAAEVEGDHRVRVHEGRLEVTDRRLQRWIWVEVDVEAHDQMIRVTPNALRILGRAVALPEWLRRSSTRPAPWLPPPVRVERLTVGADEVVVHGAVSTSTVPVDVPRLLADLGADSTMTALRIVTGDW